jgi:hypothetical protein
LENSRVQGFELEGPGGYIFEIGNEWLTRRMNCIDGRIGTTSLVHGVSCEEYLEGPIEEFALTLSNNHERCELSFRDFEYVRHSVPRADEEERLLRIDLEADFEGTKLPLSLFYQARADSDFLSKWIEIPPVNLSGWVIEWITLEHLKFPGSVEGVVPFSRYPQKYPSDEDNVHSEPEKVSVDDPRKRFNYVDKSRSVVARWGLEEGLFFFTSHLLGMEEFDRESGLLMRQKEYTPLTEGLKTGPAIIGAYCGPPGIGFKRYTEFLAKRWCVVDEKQVPVVWNTWLVTLKGNRPVVADYGRDLLIDQLKRICEAGFYDDLHLDLGWESGWPMAYDRMNFRNGLDEIVRRAKDCGLDMGFWINPFSSNYWKSDIEDEHPEWLNPTKVSGQSSAHAICPMATDYYEYVKERFAELVGRYNARVIYWDGGDWNVPHCRALDHHHTNQHELGVKAIKRLEELTKIVHESRPDAMVIGFNLPYDNHRLAALDVEQISDTHSFPTGKSELIQRQQMYQMTFEHPYRAIWGSWYGVNWHETGPDNLQRPLRELIHAEMSMIGNGACQAGAGIDLEQARPEFTEFLSKLFSWRETFAPYFAVYQHILGFPDGENVDGEAHIIDGKGFLVLINPTEQEKTINVPLDEPELELSIDQKYSITDWSDLENGRFLGRARAGDKFELDLAPLEVKFVGINVGSIRTTD